MAKWVSPDLSADVEMLAALRFYVTRVTQICTEYDPCIKKLILYRNVRRPQIQMILF